MSADLRGESDRAATALIVETGIRPPVYSYETLHALVAAAWTAGRGEGLRTAIAELKEKP